MDSGVDPGKTMMSELDFALFDALQRNPRAPWAEIARTIGVSGPTVRRHWHALVESGAGWIATYPNRIRGLMCFSVRVKCQPGFVEAVAKQLCQVPEVMSVSEMTGAYQIQLIVFVPDKSRVRPVLNVSIGQIEGISELIISLMSDVQLEGAQWNSGTLGRIEKSPNHYKFPEVKFDERVEKTLRVLECNGRAGASRIASSLGLGDPQARRIVKQFLSRRVLIQRVEAAPLHDEWPGVLALWLLVPPAKLDEVVTKIKTFPDARLCTTLVGGEANLYVILWLRSFSQANEVESDVVRGLPTRVVSRSILLQHHKRAGVLLDEEGRKIGHVPWTDSPSLHAHVLHAC